jgi:hypothetical protein
LARLAEPEGLHVSVALPGRDQQRGPTEECDLCQKSGQAGEIRHGQKLERRHPLSTLSHHTPPGSFM